MNETTPRFQLPPGTRGLIFDLDGTLADTMPLHFQAWADTLAAEGLQLAPHFLAPYAGRPSQRIVEAINAIYGTAFDPETFSLRKQVRFRELLPDAREIELIATVAREAHGRLPMAIASGGTRTNVMMTLRALSLEYLFPVIITADDPVPHKPDPAIFLEAARLIGVPPPHCLVFEDGDSGIDAARAGGIPVVDVRPLLG